MAGQYGGASGSTRGGDSRGKEDTTGGDSEAAGRGSAADGPDVLSTFKVFLFK